jgi:hypothetical protein
MLKGKHLAGATESRLYLITHQQHVVLSADSGALGEKACRWDQDASLPLDGLNEKGAGIRRNGGAERGRIAERNSLEAWHEGSEVLPVLLLRRKADNGDRTPMEVVRADNDFRVVLRNALHHGTSFARRLDRSLHSLRAGVHR